jgi:hypothetical protein
MLIQVTAYPVFGSLSLLVTSSEATETGRSWTHLIQECLEIPQALSEGSPWDLTWLIGQELNARCDRHRSDVPWFG